MASVAAPRRRTSLPVAVGTWAGGRLVTLVLLAALGWAVWSVGTSPQWRVQWVEVIGCQYLSADAVVKASGLAGAWTVALDPKVVEARVLEVPGVLAADVQVTGRSRVRITVQEDLPVANLVVGGQTYWVSAAGRVTGAASEIGSLPRVVVAGEWKDSALPGLMGGLRSLLAMYPGQREFSYDMSRGYVFTSALGCPVYFGNASDLERQVAVLSALESELGEQGVTPQFISLISVDGAYYR